MRFSLRYTHRDTVNVVKWNTNGNWLLSASRDHLVKLFDLRAMKELAKFGHRSEVTSASFFHPSPIWLLVKPVYVTLPPLIQPQAWHGTRSTKTCLCRAAQTAISPFGSPSTLCACLEACGEVTCLLAPPFNNQFIFFLTATAGNARPG